ncbi:MAG: thiol:disulfide interchange protein [Rhodospirillaceae bacterium]|nr:thiol:disulfide interchange protein [Rhodospirillaceae bacterium]
MRKFILTSTAIIAAGIAMWAVFAHKSSENQAIAATKSPPLTGWMENFTPAEPLGPAPELEILAKDGKAISLNEFRGKLVLVNFWATWCAPCIREMPSLAKLQKQRGGKEFTVLALSQDFKEWKAVNPFLEKHKLDGLPIYVDRKMATGRKLKVIGLPTTVLLSKKGQVLGSLKGIAEWDAPEALALIDHYLKVDR